MPILAIGAAIFADVAAAGAIAAGTLGTFEAIGAVGATISAIGAITGNKALSTAGLVLGGIGGVGSLASAAGIISDPSASSFFGSDASGASSMGGDLASSLTADDASNTESLLQSGIPADQGSAAIGASSNDFINNISGAAGGPTNAVNAAASSAAPPPASSGAPSTAPAADTGSITGNTGTESGSNVGNNVSYANPGGDPTQPVTPTNPVSQATISGTTPVGQAPVGTINAPNVNALPTPTIAAPATPVISDAAPDASGTSGFMSFLKSSGGGLIGMGAIQALGSFISGATNPLTPAQVALAQAQARQNNASAGLQEMQNTNLAQPIPVATRSAAPTGLINTQGAA